MKATWYGWYGFKIFVPLSWDVGNQGWSGGNLVSYIVF